MTDTILQFFEACHPFGYPLLACSIVLVAAISYHLLFTGSGRMLRRLQNATDTAAIQRICSEAKDSPLAACALLALRQGPAAEKQVEAKLAQMLDADRAGMATISVITNIAPMLGILGTAWGLVDIFGVFGTAGAEEGIAPGISKALYTTISGLAIAVPGIIALTCFERGLERRAARVNAFFAGLFAASGKN